MNKKVRVIFSPEAEEAYNYLNEKASFSKNEKIILNAVTTKRNKTRNFKSHQSPCK